MVKRGVPTVLIGTDVFEPLAKGEAAAYGFAALPLVIVPHPLGVRDAEAVRALAEQAYEGVLRHCRKE